MVAGRGLLPLLLIHALFYVISALSWFSSKWPIERSNLVRIRRSGSYYGKKLNSSFIYGDLMLEDEADPNGGIQEKVVVRGQTVLLECLEKDRRAKQTPKIKDTHPDAAVRWFHDDKEVRPDLRVTWSVVGSLRISHVVSGDSGVWRCRKDGYYRRPLRLVVTIPPERPFLVYGGAQLAEGARLTTRAGNALTLHCVVNGGNPAPLIAWFLNEKEITDNSSVRSDWKSSEDQFASLSNVTIVPVLKSHHNASVVCRVVHPALSRPLTAHLNLNIEYPPDFRLRRWPAWGSPLREGSSVSLLCLVDSNPPSSPSWIKEVDGKEEVVKSEGWLNITSVSPKYRGWYKCSTMHPFGHFSSHSVFINVLPPQNLPNGEDSKSGAPRLGISTTRQMNRKLYQGQMTPVGTQGHTPPCTSSSGSSSLCWHTFSPHDNTTKGGTVTHQYPLRQREEQRPADHAPHCPSSSDDKGTADKANDYIWRSDIKIKMMNRTHAALEGGPAMLTAHICGSPVVAQQVTWIPPSKLAALTPGISFHRWTAFNLSSPGIQKCVLSHLHIVPVHAEEDSGSWVLLVVSDQSAHAAVVHLNVTTAAKSLAAATLDVDTSLAISAIRCHMWHYGLYIIVSLFLINANFFNILL